MRTIPAAPGPPASVPASPPAPRPAAALDRPAPAWPGQELLDSPVTAHILYAVWSGDPAVVVPSPPGAGKTRLVALLAASLATRARLRVGIAAQTREQAAELSRRVSQLDGPAVLMWRREVNLPPGTAYGDLIRFPAEGGGIVIGTTARWHACDPGSFGCDIMLVDEAWQGTYADIAALGAFARQIVCVGDPGQISPVVTGSVTRWEHDPHGPHVPAPDALRAAHGDAITTVPLRHTWRLGPVTTALIQPAYYPGLPFRSLRPAEHLSGPAGPLPEVAHRAVPGHSGPGDPALTEACARRVRELLAGHILHAGASRPLAASDIAVVVPHVSQAAAVRALLDDQPDILTGTANKVQGLERPVVVALHPLAGYRDSEAAFAADPGRACVMLTRHRAHLSVILDPLAADSAGTTLLGRLRGTPAA